MTAIQRPQPIAEIVVEKVDERTLVVQGATREARAWARSEAATFGVVTFSALMDVDGFTVDVSRVFDVDQVKDYLEKGYERA